MDLIFSDVSSSFLNMVNPALSRELAVETDTAGSRQPLFADKLNTIFETEKKAGVSSRTNTLETPVAAVKDSQATMDSLVEKMSSKNGIGVVSELKNIFLMLANGNLNAVSIDADGLDALKKILVKAGFSGQDLDELMSELSEQVNDKELTLGSFFDQLFELPLDPASEPDTAGETYLETSAIPFIQSILNSLGIPPENVQEILTQADRGDQGISLDLVIEKLQTLQKQSFYGQTEFTPQGKADTIRQLFDQLGLDPGAAKQLFSNQGSDLEVTGKGPGQSTDANVSTLTLDDLVSSLEKMRQTAVPPSSTSTTGGEMPRPSLAGEKPYDLFAQLFRSLDIKNQTTGTTAFEFSYEQIKAQFTTGALGLGQAAAAQALSADNNGKQVNIIAQLKEMTSVLNGTAQGAGNAIHPSTEPKQGLKQFRSEASTVSDSFSLSTSDAKATAADLNSLKSKSGFRNLPTYVTQQVSKSIVRAINQGENILKIQLKPSELGRLVMTIDHTENSMKVSIVTDNHSAKEILTSNVNELRTVLSNSGVTLERFDVDMNSEFKQSMADARNPSGNSGNRRSNREKQALNSMNGEMMDDPLQRLDGISQDGSLHFVA